MHGDDELGDIEGSALLRVGEIPDATEDLVGQSRLLEDLLCILAWFTVSRRSFQIRVAVEPTRQHTTHSA